MMEALASHRGLLSGNTPSITRIELWYWGRQNNLLEMDLTLVLAQIVKHFKIMFAKPKPNKDFD